MGLHDKKRMFFDRYLNRICLTVASVNDWGPFDRGPIGLGPVTGVTSLMPQSLNVSRSGENSVGGGGSLTGSILVRKISQQLQNIWGFTLLLLNSLLWKMANIEAMFDDLPMNHGDFP